MRARTSVLLVLLAFLGGCVTWQPATVSPRELIEEEAPEQVRVTPRDGASLRIGNPRIVNDSLATVKESCGTPVAGGGYDCTAELTALMALHDVDAIEVRRVNGAGTGALVGVGVGYVLFALALQSCGECDGFAVGPFLTWGAILALPAGIVGAVIGWAVGP